MILPEKTLPTSLYGDLMNRKPPKHRLSPGNREREGGTSWRGCLKARYAIKRWTHVPLDDLRPSPNVQKLGVSQPPTPRRAHTHTAPHVEWVNRTRMATLTSPPPHLLSLAASPQRNFVNHPHLGFCFCCVALFVWLRACLGMRGGERRVDVWMYTK